MTEHTALPLTLKKLGDGYNLIDKNGEFVMSLGGLWFPSERQLEVFETTARLIVTACNCHADLLTKNERLQEWQRKAVPLLKYGVENLQKVDATNAELLEALKTLLHEAITFYNLPDDASPAINAQDAIRNAEEQVK